MAVQGIHRDITQAIGNTPLVHLVTFCSLKVKQFLQLRRTLKCLKSVVLSLKQSWLKN